MKVDMSKSYRGITGKAIADSIIVLSSFTRGQRTGGYGTWARRALQSCGLIAPKAFMPSLSEFIAICRKVDDAHIATIHSAADTKFASSEAADKSDKSSVARARDGMKALDRESFTLLGAAVDNLHKAGFSSVEYWLAQDDGSEVSRVDSLANIVNDTFYRGVTNSMRANAIGKRGLGNGVATKRAKTKQRKTQPIAA